MAINRFGLNRRQTGPLMRSTLEESVQMLMDAGIYSEFDPTNGPSERVALGRRVAHGTGTHFQLKPTEGVEFASEAIEANREIVAKRTRINPYSSISANPFQTNEVKKCRMENPQLLSPFVAQSGPKKRRNEYSLACERIATARAEVRKKQMEDESDTSSTTTHISNAIGKNPFGDRKRCETKLHISNPFSKKRVIRNPFDDDECVEVGESTVKSMSSASATKSYVPSSPKLIRS